MLLRPTGGLAVDSQTWNISRGLLADADPLSVAGGWGWPYLHKPVR